MLKSKRNIIKDYDDFILKFFHDCCFAIYDKVNNTQYAKEMEYIYLHSQEYSIFELTTELNLSRSTLYEHIEFINRHIVHYKELLSDSAKFKQFIKV